MAARSKPPQAWVESRLGGKAAVENLQKRETKAAIRVAVEFQGVIGH